MVIKCGYNLISTVLASVVIEDYEYGSQYSEEEKKVLIISNLISKRFIIDYFRVSDVQLLYNAGQSPGQFRQDNNTCEILDNSEYLADTSRKYNPLIHRSTKTLQLPFSDLGHIEEEEKTES